MGEKKYIKKAPVKDIKLELRDIFPSCLLNLKQFMTVFLK